MSPMIKKIGIKGFRVLESEFKGEVFHVKAELSSSKRPPCPQCSHRKPQIHSKQKRKVRHLEVFGKESILHITHPRYRCSRCQKTFNPVLPGVMSGKQSSEPFRERIARFHHEGIPGKVMAGLAKIGSATVERIYQHFNRRKAAERTSLQCPTILGIDEHTLHKKQRFATTFCDLKNHRVFEVIPGKSHADLEGFLTKLQGREKVKVVCIDLSCSYRSLIRRYFPHARIVADRFHVVRLIIHHFMNLARAIAPEIKHQRGILNALRMNPENLKSHQQERLKLFFANWPAIEALYHQMHRLRVLMNQKHRTKRQCRPLTRRLFAFIKLLKKSGLAAMVTLAQTLEQWAEPIACMWRFTKSNGITEGFHRKMKLIQRRAYGFRNFDNYRLRVLAQCG